MPFTFSHPALIIPLLRHRLRWPWLSATGLIAGSVAPDFEKFFHLRLASDYSHTVASLLYFSCPVGLGLAFLFHGVVRQPLLQHLPAPLHQRLAGLALANWLTQARKHPFGLLFSILLGAITHLLWDSFTHHNAWLAYYLPWLERVVVLPGYRVYTYSFLALLSSVGGGLAIGWAVWQLPRQWAATLLPTAALWHYWGLLVLVAAGLLGGWVLITHPRQTSIPIAGVSALLLGVLLVSACSRLRQKVAHK